MKVRAAIVSAVLAILPIVGCSNHHAELDAANARTDAAEAEAARAKAAAEDVFNQLTDNNIMLRLKVKGKWQSDPATKANIEVELNDTSWSQTIGVGEKTQSVTKGFKWEALNGDIVATVTSIDGSSDDLGKKIHMIYDSSNDTLQDKDVFSIKLKRVK